MLLLRDTYNAIPEKAKAECRENGRTMSEFDMDKLLTAMKAEKPKLNTVYSRALQNVAKRVAEAYAGFFSRVKRKKEGAYHGKVGFPRPKKHREPDLPSIWVSINRQET